MPASPAVSRSRLGHAKATLVSSGAPGHGAVSLRSCDGRLISYDASMEARDLAVGLACGRIAIGVVSLLAPGLVGRSMFGLAGDSGGMRRFLRVVGARDLVLGIGVLAALDRHAPVHGWLRASAVVDGLDAAASLLARHHLRPIVVPAAAGAASAGALLGGWLAGQLDA